MSQGYKFIIIDDDALNNKICSIVIKKAYPDCRIDIFPSTVSALKYFREQECEVNIQPAVVFLDIYMDEMNGWDFLREYDGLSAGVKANFDIYILSCSVRMEDSTRASRNSNIRHFLTKPLETEMVRIVTRNFAARHTL